MFIRDIQHWRDSIDQRELDARLEERAHLSGFVGATVVDANSMLLEKLRVGRIDRRATEQLNEVRLHVDGFVDILERVCLPFHVADLDSRIDAFGGVRGIGSTRQKCLIQSIVGNDAPGDCFGQFRLALEMDVEPDVVRHDRQCLIERRNPGRP